MPDDRDDKKVPPARKFPEPREPPLKTTRALTADVRRRILAGIVKRARCCR